MTRVYVIAAYAEAPTVRAIHDRLRMIGCEPTSSWAESAHGAEDLASLSDAECARIWDRNDVDMQDATVVLLLADTPAREGWMEAQRALDYGKRLLCVGRPTLTLRAFDRVEVVDSIDAALAAIEGGL